jgi:hypothetical protein
MSSRRDFLTATALTIAATAQAKPSKPLVPQVNTPAVTPSISPSVTGSRWEPSKTWVFAVGVLAYPDGQAWPDEGRQDAVMIDQLQTCGVPKEQVLFIKDKKATLKETQKSFVDFLTKAPSDATLWFYFAGHGDKNKSGTGQFCLYDENWAIPSMLSSIERYFKGQRALLFADCCYSGSLGMEAMLRAGRVACGALASSLSSTLSTGAWTFTECLIAGLRGEIQVDADGDGQVNFLELGRYAEREMAMNDDQLSTFVATNGFNPDLVLMSGIKREDPRIGEYVDAKSKDGKYYPGRIDKVDGTKFFIKWAGYTADKNEWVESTNTRAYAPKQHAPGTKVSIEWEGEWYPAQVLTARYGMHLIHYNDFEDVWDEWVAPSRLKLV